MSAGSQVEAVLDRDNKISREESEISRSAEASIPLLGRVIRSGVGSYDYLVSIAGEDPIVCSMASSSNWSPFGYSRYDMPIEGSTVLVVRSVDATNVGYIVGIVNTIPGKIRPERSKSKRFLQPQAELYDGPNSDTEDIYAVPRSKNDGKSLYFGDTKLGNMFPGELAIVNENGVGIVGDELSVAITGGSSKVSASLADGTVEIVSRNFRQYGIGGTSKLFCDAGYITSESTFSEFLGERKGGLGLNSVNVPDSDEDRPVGKYRLRLFEGYLGGLVSGFISRPDDSLDKPKSDTDTSHIRRESDHEPKDNGTMQFNLDENGRLMFRSAGGFMLERSDRIPVPMRIRDPDDPNGTDASKIDRDPLLPFDMPLDDNTKEPIEKRRSPHYMPLALADRMAYEYRQSFDRFLEFVDDPTNKKSGDFYIRNEEDLDPLDDDVGIDGREIVKDRLHSNTGRKSGIYNMPDGSIILRDAWGSEIIMSGGNITINTPGNIQISPGMSLITLSGDDTVIKARNSIDIDSSDRDITLTGDKNVKIIAGSDNSEDAGGILLESLSGTYSDIVPDRGENMRMTGIMLKARKSSIGLFGDKTVVGANRSVVIATGGEEKNDRTGSVFVTSDTVRIHGKSGASVSSASSGILTANGSVAISGDNAVIHGDQGVAFSTSSSVGVPLWFGGAGVGGSSMKSYFTGTSLAAREDTLLFPYVPKDLFEDNLFSFRTSKQCNTFKGTELTDRRDVFTLYQPYWSVLSEMGVSILDGIESLDTWTDHTIDGEYPWPGTDAVTKGKYAKLDHGDTESLNTKVEEIEVQEEDRSGKRTGKKTKVSVSLSKDYKDIARGKKDNGALIKLVDVGEYLVPSVDFPYNEETSKETKRNNGDKNSKNNTRKTR